MNEVDPKDRKRDNLDPRIRREIREWTARPPARSPKAARTRVLAHIDERRPRTSARWLFAVAAAMVAVLAGGLLWLRGSEAPFESQVRMASAAPPTSTPAEAASAGLLVYELESGTKLYMALAVTTPFAKTTMEGN